jgi:hypothetical protein
MFPWRAKEALAGRGHGVDRCLDTQLRFLDILLAVGGESA